MKFVFYIFAFVFVSFSLPSWAYRSGDTFYVNRKRKPKTPLVQKKFVIMQSEKSFQETSSNTQNTFLPEFEDSEISLLGSQVKEVKNLETKSSNSSSVKNIQTYNPNEDWDSFAVESEFIEEKNVSAKIKNY